MKSPAFLPLQEAIALQEAALRELTEYAGGHSAFYRELFSKNGIESGQIRTLDDLHKIPTTSKEDLQQRNDDFRCVPLSRIAEYMSTSGTLGSPVTITLTANDLTRLARNEFGSFQCADGTAADIYQLMLTLDRQFMAGIAYYSGIRMLGAGVVRLGPGVPSLQLETIRQLKPTVIVAVPSFILKLISHAEEAGFDLNTSSVKKAVCIGENIRLPDHSLNTLGKRITDRWKIALYSTYASTEMQTAFTECGAGRGGHLQPDLVIAELLDEAGDPVPDGEEGEVTITTLGVEGMPLLRYRTGDICIADRTPCSCGRTSLRLSPVIGRRKQMIKFKGTTLYPPALFDILAGMEDVIDYAVEVYSNEVGLDEVLINILTTEGSEETGNRIKAYLQARLRVTPGIKFVTADDLQRMHFARSDRKAAKFADRRK